MKCIEAKDIYYYCLDSNGYIFIEPYSSDYYTFIIQVFDEYNKNKTIIFFTDDLFEVEHYLFWHENSIVYLVNKITLQIKQII